MPRTSLDHIVAEMDTVVMPGIVHWGHPAFLGYFGSTSNGAALVGEMIAAALNVSAMTWQTSPAATELETVVLGWIRRMIGLPDAIHGRRVRHGVDRACCTRWPRRARGCGVEVRERGTGRPHRRVRHRVYASDQAHSSIEKAMIVLGLGEAERGPDPERRGVSPRRRGAARRQSRTTCAPGYRPMAVIATVGTTSTTSVDPVAGDRGGVP